MGYLKIMLPEPAIRNPRKLSKAIRLRAEGKSAVDTAALVGVHPRTIWRWEDRVGVKRKIEEQAQQLMELAPKAIDTYRQIFEASSQAEVVPHLLEYPLVDETGAVVFDAEGKPLTRTEPADSKVINNHVKLLALAKDAANDVLTVAGIMPTHSIAHMVQNIFISGSDSQLSPLVGRILGQLPAPESTDPQVIDAEFEPT